MNSKTGKLLIQFGNLVIENFSELLNNYGFELNSKRVEDKLCKIIFTKKKMHVVFVATVNPLDYPPFYNILLGEGSLKWPDYDWNHVSLLHMLEPYNKSAQSKKLRLADLAKLKTDFNDIKQLLLENATDFLRGDLKRFHSIRKQLNKNRSSYMIYTPNKKGYYNKNVDSESLKLKEKYS